MCIISCSHCHYSLSTQYEFVNSHSGEPPHVANGRHDLVGIACQVVSARGGLVDASSVLMSDQHKWEKLQNWLLSIKMMLGVDESDMEGEGVDMGCDARVMTTKSEEEGLKW